MAQRGRFIQTRRDPREAEAQRKKKKPKPPPASKALVALQKAPPGMLLALVFWKMRHLIPDLAVTLTEREVEALKQSLDYAGQKPKIETAALQGFFVVRMADESTGDPIATFENTEEALKVQAEAKQAWLSADSMPGLIGAVRGEFAGGVTSQSSINNLCEAAAHVTNYLRSFR